MIQCAARTSGGPDRRLRTRGGSHRCGAEADLLAQLVGNWKHRALDAAGQLLDRSNEPVAAAVNGLHDPLIPSRVTDRLAELFDRVVNADSVTN